MRNIREIPTQLSVPPMPPVKPPKADVDSEMKEKALLLLTNNIWSIENQISKNVVKHGRKSIFDIIKEWDIEIYKWIINQIM